MSLRPTGMCMRGRSSAGNNAAPSLCYRCPCTPWAALHNITIRSSGGCAPRRRLTLFACPKRVSRKMAPRSWPAARVPCATQTFGGRTKTRLRLKHLSASFAERPLRSGCVTGEHEEDFGLGIDLPPPSSSPREGVFIRSCPGRMSERSEFSSRPDEKAAAREPAVAKLWRAGLLGCPFFASFLWASKERKAPGRARPATATN